MKNLPKKFIKHLREKGVRQTFKKVAKISLEKLVAQKKDLRAELASVINQHNQNYAKINKLVLTMHGGIHPKHRILNYHRFFIDQITTQEEILDIGCGNGYLAYDLAHQARAVIGIDIDPKNIESAKANYPKNNLQFLLGDATTYQFGKTVNKIVLSNVLEHIENRPDFLQSLHRIAPVILLRVPLITRDWLAYYKREQGFEYRLDSTHFIEYTIEELSEELKKSGWKLEKYQINWGELWGTVGEMQNL